MSTLVNHLIGKVTLENVSGLPRDRVVNTFHFQRLGTNSLSTDANNLKNMLAAFYTVAPTASIDASTAVLSTFLSPSISRTAGIHKIDVYDGSTDPPRTPILSLTFTAAAAAFAGGLPNEVALCGSFRSQTAGVPLARQRGRVFIGPLCNGSTVLSATAIGGDWVPPSTANAIVDTIGACMSKLIEDSKGTAVNNGPSWCVFSTVNNALYRATAAYVDLAFDTQRRRGARASSRVASSPNSV